MRVRLILATALSSVPALAFAHPGGPGALGFTEGFLHPLTGLDHLTAAVIVGLLAVLARPAGAVLSAFLGALAAGLFMGAALPLIASAAEIGILLTFAALAGAFILRKTRAWIVPLGAGVTGLAHGLAHGADGAGAAAFAAGVLAVTAALVLAGCLVGIGCGGCAAGGSAGPERRPIAASIQCLIAQGWVDRCRSFLWSWPWL